MVNPILKNRNQNLFDYILTNYGSLEYLKTFLNDNNIDDIMSFSFEPINTKYIISSVNNNTVNTFKKLSYIIATGGVILNPDFNNDFNEDFFI